MPIIKQIRVLILKQMMRLSERQEINNRCSQIILEILSLLGFETNGSDDIRKACPIHGGNNPSAFKFNFRLNRWSCFSHHCHENTGGDIVGLVMGIRKCSLDNAIGWLKDILEHSPEVNSRKGVQIEPLTFTPNKEIDEDILEQTLRDYRYIKERGLTKHTIDFFDLRLAERTYAGNYRIIVPIRNEDGKLVAITGRTILPKCKHCDQFHSKKFSCEEQWSTPKWKHYPPKFRKTLELFNLHNAKKFIQQSNTAVIFEGPINVMKAWQAGINNSVATMGISLSKYQSDLLKKYECVNIILMYDDDVAGTDASHRVYNRAKNSFRVYTPYVDIPCPYQNKVLLDTIKNLKKIEYE